MKPRAHWMSVAAASLAVLVVNDRGTSRTATTDAPAIQDTMPKRRMGMNMPMMGPHHILAMAYRENVATFARALRMDVARSKKVDADLAKPAVAEMRRSFDEMQKHKNEMVSAMEDTTKTKQAAMMKHMEDHITEMGKHLSELEADIAVSQPDPAKVQEHTAEIIKQCEGMMTMPGKKAMPRRK